MTAQVTQIEARPDRRRLPSRKVVPLPIGGLAAPDAIGAWAGRYLDAAIRGVRSAKVADKIALHLARSATTSTSDNAFGNFELPPQPVSRFIWAVARTLTSDRVDG